MNTQLHKKANFAARLLLILVVPVIILTLYHNGYLQRFSLIGYDFLYKIRGDINVNNKILLIKQDEVSTNFYNTRLSDWPRSNHAKLIQKLSHAGADIIVFDYDFSRPSKPSDDQAFASAIAAAGNVILANRLLASGEMAQPLSIFTDNTLGEGFIDTVLDIDGIWRRLIYSSKSSDGYLHFSLPMVSTEIYEDFPLEKRVLNDTEALGWGDHQLPYPDMLINFAGGNNSYPYISFYKILEDDFDASLIQGKIILVGNTHPLGKDIFTVPTDRRMSGLEVHANSISTILDDRYIQRIDSKLFSILIIISGLCGGILIFLKRPNLRTNLLVFVIGSSIILLSAGYFFTHLTIWLDFVPLLQVFLLNTSVATGYQWRLSRKRENEIRGLFGHYVSKNVVEAILSENIPVKLDGHRTEVTVLFSDIRGFTSISETLSPSDLGQLLNHYFDEMIAAVFQYNGTLDKLMGDAVMAFFGSPIEASNHQHQACQCAQTMIERLKKLNLSGKLPDGVRIEIGIGLHTGEAIVGNLGSSEFADYTVIGDTVNLASRIEGLNKRYATTIIISEDTYQCVSNNYLCRELDQVIVKGKEKPKRIYEMMLDTNAINKQRVTVYEEALNLYRNKQWQDAIICLKQLPTDTEEDKTSTRLMEECETLLTQPEDKDWASITSMKEK